MTAEAIPDLIPTFNCIGSSEAPTLSGSGDGGRNTRDEIRRFMHVSMMCEIASSPVPRYVHGQYGRRSLGRWVRTQSADLADLPFLPVSGRLTASSRRFACTGRTTGPVLCMTYSSIKGRTGSGSASGGCSPCSAEIRSMSWPFLRQWLEASGSLRTPHEPSPRSPPSARS